MAYYWERNYLLHVLPSTIYTSTESYHIQSLSPEIHYLRWKTFPSLYENHSNNPCTFAQFFSKFYSIFLLIRWPKMYAVFKISMDSYNSLMGFSFFFFFKSFCSFYPFLTLFCLPFWPPLSIELTFSQNYSQWVQDPSWVIIGNLERITVYV